MAQRGLSRLTTCASAACLAACGGVVALQPDASLQPDSGDGSSMLADAEAAADASDVADVRNTAPDARAEVSTMAAGVGLVSFRDDAFEGSVSAEFYPGVSVLPSACPGATYGPCVVWPPCARDFPPGGVSAGTLTLVGTAWGDPQSLEQGAAGIYGTPSLAPPFYPGAALTVSASGGVVPAFGPFAVQGPSSVVLAIPNAIPTTHDLDMTWTGGQPGTEVVVMLSANGVTSDLTECTFDATSGQGTVPAAALAPLAGQADGRVDYGQAVSSSFMAGGWVIDVQATLSLTQAVVFQ